MGFTLLCNSKDLRPQQDQVTIGDIRPKGLFYRHPDTATISYPEVLAAGPLGSLDKSRSLKIAIVGAGAAGVTALYELSRLVERGQSGQLCVTIYEPDPEHFSRNKHQLDPKTRQIQFNVELLQAGPAMIEVAGKKAGRVFAARSSTVNGKPHAVYEIGAMRFPEVAGLTWHYARELFGDAAVVEAFPNPGAVPTEFVYGDRVDRYEGDNFVDPNSPTKKAVHVVRRGIVGLDEDFPEVPAVSLFPIGGRDPAKVSAELKSEHTKPERLAEIKSDWKKFLELHADLSLGGALRQVIERSVDSLPQVDGVSGREARINYYFELIGCFGFGTGGFKPLFGCAFVEMMRLFLWSYANEYLLPEVEENYQFIEKIFNLSLEVASKHSDKLKLFLRHERVSDVCHCCQTGNALIFSEADQAANEQPAEVRMEEFDFVILATAPQQMSAITSRAGYSNLPRHIRFGHHARPYPETVLARGPFILSNKSETPNMRIPTAIQQINMISSSKIFATIERKIFEEMAPKFMLNNQEKQVRALVSDCGLGSSYAVKSGLNEEYLSFLISYNWEHDTKRLQHHFRSFPMNAVNVSINSGEMVGKENEDKINHEKMINDIINYADRDVKIPRDPKEGSSRDRYHRWWFADLLSKKDEEGQSCLKDTLSYDWNTSDAGGGFKVDLPGGSYNSALCFRYHTHALDVDLKNRFFIAGDSYSHLGGWLEGAFMSAVNAVSGLIVAANGGGPAGLAKLSNEARKLMESFERVSEH